MKKMFIRCFGLAVILAVASATRAQTVVYANNTTLFGGGVVLSLSNGDTIGNTITLSTGSPRNVVGFSFQFYATNTAGSFSGTPQLDVRLWDNTGATVGSPGVPAPNNLLYDSTYFGLLFPAPTASGNINFTTADFGVGGLTVPDTLTWTVTVSGLGSGDQFGLVAFGPPTVGADANYYWQNVDGNWETHTNSIQGANSFGVVVQAVPEPGTLSIAAFGGIALLAAFKRRQTK